MDRKVKLIIFPTILIAIGCGFLRNLDGLSEVVFWPTLHIFLFNLTCGGVLLLAHLSGKKDFGAREYAFYIMAVAFSICAAADVMLPCIVLALIMSVLVETVRWKRFSFFPWDFFRAEKASRKFEQAALLCLSMGLGICALTLINDSYLKLVNFEKLGMHVFYLGFSFPVSLITFGYIFRLLEGCERPPSRLAGEFGFWALNLGVIFFFIFIVFEIFPIQFLMAVFLFSVVCITIYLHATRWRNTQKQKLVSSALAFLTLGSMLGVLYVIVLWTTKDYKAGYLLNLHSAANVFGWNMTWIVLVIRKDEFPIKRGLAWILALHWVAIGLMPLGREIPIYGIPGILTAAAFLYLAFFSPAENTAGGADVAEGYESP